MQYLHKRKSLPCAKGGGFCVAKLGGIVSKFFHFANTSYRWLYNPSVGFADSSLCTREPNEDCD